MLLWCFLRLLMGFLLNLETRKALWSIYWWLISPKDMEIWRMELMISRIIDGSLILIGTYWCRRSFLCLINQQSSKNIHFFLQRKNFHLWVCFLSSNRSANDTSNFSSYPESDHLSPALKPSEDPFLDW